MSHKTVLVVELLRWCQTTAHVRILGITGCTSTIAQERMRRLCDGLLLKPCVPELVASRIRALVEVAA